MPTLDPLSLPPVPPPAPDDHPWRDRILTIVFALALAAALVGAIKNRHLGLTAFENRHTAPWPGLPRSLSAFHDFTAGFEAAFADRFGGRNLLITLHHLALADFAVSPVSKVMLGSDGWLFFLGEDSESLDRDFRGVKPYPPEEPYLIAAEFKRRHDFLASLGIPYIVMIVPDKYTVYSEYLPPWVPRPHGDTRLDRLYETLRRYPEVEVLDLRPALGAAKVQDRVYFKTDSHWNFLGATVAYEQLIAAAKAKLPSIPAVPPIRPPYVPGVDFYSGDLSHMLGMDRRYTEDDIAPLSKVLGDASQRCAKPSDKLPSVAQSPPAETLVFECPRPELPTALVYRDSMADLLMPLLSDNFRRVVYVSSRHLDRELVLAEHPDIVIEEMVERSIHAAPALPM